MLFLFCVVVVIIFLNSIFTFRSIHRGYDAMYYYESSFYCVVISTVPYLHIPLQGTNLRRYFRKVAAHHGLQFAVTEFDVAEDPGSYDDATFYVTHLREPVSRDISQLALMCRVTVDLFIYRFGTMNTKVSRSISHFKCKTLFSVYHCTTKIHNIRIWWPHVTPFLSHALVVPDEGRWECKDLIYNNSFVPTEENAQKLETWNQQHGHHPSYCQNIKDGEFVLRMSMCAVNCYVRLFSVYVLYDTSCIISWFEQIPLSLVSVVCRTFVPLVGSPWKPRTIGEANTKGGSNFWTIQCCKGKITEVQLHSDSGNASTSGICCCSGTLLWCARCRRKRQSSILWGRISLLQWKGSIGDTKRDPKKFDKSEWDWHWSLPWDERLFQRKLLWDASLGSRSVWNG